MNEADRILVANLIWAKLKRVMYDKWDISEVVDYGSEFDMDVIDSIEGTLDKYVNSPR